MKHRCVCVCGPERGVEKCTVCRNMNVYLQHDDQSMNIKNVPPSLDACAHAYVYLVLGIRRVVKGVIKVQQKT